MNYILNLEVAKWLDSVRGNLSQQSYITKLLKEQMQHTYHTKGTNEESYTNGAIDALSSIKQY